MATRLWGMRNMLNEPVWNDIGEAVRIHVCEQLQLLAAQHGDVREIAVKLAHEVFQFALRQRTRVGLVSARDDAVPAVHNRLVAISLCPRGTRLYKYGKSKANRIEQRRIEQKNRTWVVYPSASTVRH